MQRSDHIGRSEGIRSDLKPTRPIYVIMLEDLYCAVTIKMFWCPLKQIQRHDDALYRFERAKYGIQQLVERVGFFGILAAARWLLSLFVIQYLSLVSSSSIPNPLFDLAGITCGHFLVPFWTFFGATLIGKAVIKMHIQVGISIDRVVTLVSFSENLRYLGFQQRAL